MKAQNDYSDSLYVVAIEFEQRKEIRNFWCVYCSFIREIFEKILPPFIYPREKFEAIFRANVIGQR